MKKSVKESLKKTKLYDFVKLVRHLKEQYNRLVYPLMLHRAKVNRKRPTESGITSVFYDNKKVIVSLTTFPDRIVYVCETLHSIMHQTKKPNLIILWLAREQFPHGEENLPSSLLLLKQYGLSIEWVDDDWKSYKKIIPALTQYPDDIIVTADDDLYYPSYWLKSLIASYFEFPQDIQGHLITAVSFTEDRFVFKDRYLKEGTGEASFCCKILSGSGTLFPPHCMYQDVTDANLFMSLAPTNDDIWLWAMAIMNNTKVRWIKHNMVKLYWVEHTQEETPCLVTENNQGPNKRESQTKAVFDKYQLYSRLVD